MYLRSRQLCQWVCRPWPAKSAVKPVVFDINFMTPMHSKQHQKCAMLCTVFARKPRSRLNFRLLHSLSLPSPVSSPPPSGCRVSRVRHPPAFVAIIAPLLSAAPCWSPASQPEMQSFYARAQPVGGYSPYSILGRSLPAGLMWRPGGVRRRVRGEV